MNMSDDERYMRRCLQLAGYGMAGAKPNPMVGAVIVARGRIIGEGYHVRCGEGHAEVNAFASVAERDERLLPEATIYVSLEPCAHYGKTPPCAELIVRKGVRRVVVGCVDPFPRVSGRGIERLRAAGIEVEVGVLERECRELNRRFITFNTLHRPYILLKWAQTANGFIDDNYCQTAISTPFTTMLAHKLRSEYDAILVGRITFERDHPRLDVRHWVGKSPRKIVLTRATPLRELMETLHSEGVQSLLVEGGAATHASFMAEGLFDEIRVETSPAIVSGGTRAAMFPQNVELAYSECIDGNQISTYRRLAPNA